LPVLTGLPKENYDLTLIKYYERKSNSSLFVIINIFSIANKKVEIKIIEYFNRKIAFKIKEMNYIDITFSDI